MIISKKNILDAFHKCVVHMDQKITYPSLLARSLLQLSTRFSNFLRRRLLRWLDQKQRLGFTSLEPRSIESLLTLATLAPSETTGGDGNIKRLAQMVLYLMLFELQNAYWKVGHYC